MYFNRSTPERQGVPSEAIQSFLDDVEKEGLELHGLFFVRNGEAIAEGAWAPYQLEEKHEMFSVTKSITSTAIGIAIDEEMLSLEDKVISFFPEYAHVEMDRKMKDMTVRDLLTMMTGNVENYTGSTMLSQIKGSWVKEFLQQPLIHQPGKTFMYSSATSHILSAIISKATGENIAEYLTPRLFEPLNIEDYSWDVDPEGYLSGGWGMRLKIEDLAKVGQLYLQKGVWEGKRLLSEAYIAQATSFQVSTAEHTDRVDSQQGYGFQFWMMQNGAYRAAGMYGQICVVLPEQNAVFVVTAGSEKKQEVLDAFWKNIFPYFEADSLPENSEAHEQLQAQLKSLAVLPDLLYSDSPIVAEVSGRQYIMRENEDQIEAVTFDFSGDTCVFTLTDPAGEHVIKCGLGKWIDQQTTMPGAALHLLQQPEDLPVKARGYWENETTFVMQWVFYQMAFIDTVRCHLVDDKIIYRRSVNDPGPYLADRPSVIGRFAAKES